MTLIDKVAWIRYLRVEKTPDLRASIARLSVSPAQPRAE